MQVILFHEKKMVTLGDLLQVKNVVSKCNEIRRYKPDYNEL